MVGQRFLELLHGAAAGFIEHAGNGGGGDLEGDQRTAGLLPVGGGGEQQELGEGVVTGLREGQAGFGGELGNESGQVSPAASISVRASCGFFC